MTQRIVFHILRSWQLAKVVIDSLHKILFNDFAIRIQIHFYVSSLVQQAHNQQHQPIWVSHSHLNCYRLTNILNQVDSPDSPRIIFDQFVNMAFVKSVFIYIKIRIFTVIGILKILCSDCFNYGMLWSHSHMTDFQEIV